MESGQQQHPRCIWVDAGVIAYKLCDLDFRCEECAFDSAMKRSVCETSLPKPVAAAEASISSADVVDRYFAAFDPLQFPGDRLYLPGHVWVSRNDDGSYTVGIDHVAAALVGPLASIVLPQSPSILRADAPCCWLVHHDGTIAIPSPFESDSVWYNENLSRRPDLLAEKPYTDGWIFRSVPAGGEAGLRNQRSASENASAILEELGILKREIIAQLRPRPGIGTSAFDGGRPVQTAFEMIGPAAFALIARMFLVPGLAPTHPK
ncbi:MAG: hypothetical protein HBSIN02_15480 [Bacteroidia bacterium]|nr:MAG: hypothetical protein HBSIN02_15480 [Bacteroidia bacterium]